MPADPGRLDGVDELYFDVVSQVKMDRWSQGRVQLIGDAAGCISLLGGEGTGLAMTESYVLAGGELQRADGDYRTAFRRYEDRLRPLHRRQADRGGGTDAGGVLRCQDPVRRVVP